MVDAKKARVDSVPFLLRHPNGVGCDIDKLIMISISRVRCTVGYHIDLYVDLYVV